MRIIVLVWLASFSLPTTSAGAQKKGEKIPKRPTLVASADTNDWRSYFDFGMSAIHKRPAVASDAFYWATRLNPASAEAFYARWVAELKKDRQFLREYLAEHPQVVGSKRAMRIDSLRYQALLRNPLVFQGLWVTLLDDLPVEPEDQLVQSIHPLERGFRAYNAGDFAGAASAFGKLLESSPQRFYLFRYERALAFHAMNQYDSAANELTLLLDEMRRREEKKVVYMYRSKELLAYALGLLHAQAGRFEKAREVFGEALAEDMSFSTAHSALGTMALGVGDTVAAASEFGLASQLNPDDPTLRHDYGGILFSSRQYEDAVVELREAIRLEPYFANSYLILASSLDKQGKPVEAAEEYAIFLKRAPRSQARQIEWVTTRLAQIQARARN